MSREDFSLLETSSHSECKKTKMGVLCWMFAILLGCTLSEDTQTSSVCTCNGKLQVFCGPNNEVYVPCMYVDSSIISFTLYKEQQKLYIVKCDQQNKTLNCTQTEKNTTDTTYQTQDLTLSFILTKPSYGTYKCESSKEFPPPYKTVLSEAQVQAPQCNISKNAANPEQQFLWIWIIAVSLLSFYSLIVTVMAFVWQMKLKKVDFQSDYMNTKPRAAWGPKKRGVQNPTPRC